MVLLSTSPTFWLLVVLWATATAVFLAKLSKRHLVVLVILLSLLLLAALLRERGRTPDTTPTVRLVSSAQVMVPG